MTNREHPALIVVPLIVVAVAIAIGGRAIWRTVASDRRARQNPFEFDAELARFKAIDPALIHYSETGQIALPFARPRALATGPEGELIAAGDEQVAAYDPESGEELWRADAGGEPTSVAVAEDGTVYLGVGDHVNVLVPRTGALHSWAPVADLAMITSVVATDTGVYVADAASRLVFRLDSTGAVAGRIGERDP